tara:strand:+ start:126 stop:401 length:276 start_codon:yes stop_codon:yes gene_type:complete
MILQLPNGRIIECSVEQYLSMSDEEIRDLNGIGSAYTKEVANPFYGLYANTTVARREALEDMRAEQEYEPRLDEIDSLEKFNDDYFHSDDI